MKKLLYTLLFGLSLFVFQGENLFADNFSDCLDLERLKAKSDGATSGESVDQAERICKLKFNKANRKSSSKKGSAENTEKVQNKASENTTASAEFNRSIDKPDFSVDLLFGSKEVKIIEELCKENSSNFLEGKCDRHPVRALLLDLFIIPNISIAFGYFDSTYNYQYPFSDITYSYTTSETSLGGRLHLKKGRDRKGLDLFVGAGSVTIERCHNYEDDNNSAGRFKIEDCAEKETGGYSEGGIKYVTQHGFSIGYYLRASSPERYGGTTSGLTLGWTW